MIIGITINNVLRDHISPLCEVYEELTGKEAILPINPYDLEKSFPKIESTEIASEFSVNSNQELINLEYNEGDEAFDVFELIYKSAPLEIFGCSEEIVSGTIHKLKEIESKSKVDIILLNKESSRSKGATLFFLSKCNFDLSQIIFPDKEKDFWNHVDVLITDNPKILKSKPKNKISVKVENEFNIDIKSDYSIIGVSDTKTLKTIIKSIKTSLKNG